MQVRNVKILNAMIEIASLEILTNNIATVKNASVEFVDRPT